MKSGFEELGPYSQIVAILTLLSIGFFCGFAVGIGQSGLSQTYGCMIALGVMVVMFFVFALAYILEKRPPSP